MTLRPNNDEKNRHERSNPAHHRRFHYRYKAAELAWKAVELMPDQSDETATFLCEAGSWVKVLDPVFADRFYKALVNRCGKTELGKAADRKRWFPKIDDNGSVKLKR